MQNSSLSLLATLCLSTALFVAPASAQNATAKTNDAQPTAQAQAKNAVNNQGQAADKKANAKPAANGQGQAADKKANAKPAETGQAQAADKSNGAQPAENNAAKEEERKLLEAELNNTDVDSTEILDFPARTSLGEIEMATLPGVKESLINGPASMAPSVSTKDLPSEQLLGRITSEVFQEMADLERGNVFLKLQMQKEQLKNDLEKLKATYRQNRLEEIAKREDVVRSRIAWWQEQEAARLEMEKKKAETEAIEQQITEAEELRNKLREEAIAEKEAAKKKAIEKAAAEAAKALNTVETPVVAEQTKANEQNETLGDKLPILSDTYSLISVRGMKSNLSASLKNKKDGSLSVVKKGDVLPSGHHVIEITKESLIAEIENRKDILLFAVEAKTDDESGTVGANK